MKNISSTVIFRLTAFLFFFMVVIHTATAYSFSSNGLYFYITSDTTCSVCNINNRTDYYNYLNLESVIIPSEVTTSNGKTYSVTGIEHDAFHWCTSLTSVNIPNSVTSIGYAAFYECEKLTSINIPNYVTSIGYDAFHGCKNLTSINIPTSVTSIGYAAFYECEKLTSINIPNSVISIEGNTFHGCKKLTSINIPNSVTSIGDCAFYGCSLTSINIPNSVTSIGYAAFYGCSFTDIIIPSSVTTIGSSGIDSRRTIWLPSTPPTGYKNATANSIINYVSNNSYSNLSNITMTYPNLSSMFEVDGIRYLPNPSERTCDALYYIDSNTTTNINIGNTVEYKGVEMTVRELEPYFCYDNKYVKEVVIPNTVTSIGTACFFGCTDLNNIVMSEGIETIGDNAFSGCSSLEELTFGAKLKSIGSGALSSCAALTKLTVKAEVPPTCGTQALDDINKWTCTLCVPAAQLDAYKAADQWKDFFFFETIETGVESTSADDVTEVERFSIDGTRLTSPAKGINIVKYSDGSVRKVFVK